MYAYWRGRGSAKSVRSIYKWPIYLYKNVQGGRRGSKSAILERTYFMDGPLFLKFRYIKCIWHSSSYGHHLTDIFLKKLSRDLRCSYDLIFFVNSHKLDVDSKYYRFNKVNFIRSCLKLALYDQKRPEIAQSRPFLVTKFPDVPSVWTYILKIL